MQSHWFKRFKKETENLSPHFRFKYLKLGFWRIYWKDHYFHEVFEEMPPIGYDFEGYDPRLERQEYYEEFEEHTDLVRKIKNYVEGYYDSTDRARRRFFNLRHDAEFFEASQKAYQQITVK